MKPIKQLLTKPYAPVKPFEPSKTYEHEEFEEVCELDGSHGSSIGDDVFDLAEVFAHVPGANLAEMSVTLKYNGDYDTTLMVGKVKKTVKQNTAYDGQMKLYIKEMCDYNRDCVKYEADLKAYERQQAELDRTKLDRDVKKAIDLLKKHGYIQG